MPILPAQAAGRRLERAAHPEPPAARNLPRVDGYASVPQRMRPPFTRGQREI